MGTNFYMFTKSKENANKYAPYSYELTDEPEWGYTFHVAKTSLGWLPLFQGHLYGIRSIGGYKNAYDDGCKIFDEYGNFYDWEAFVERVLEYNGGTRGANNNEANIISHLDYSNQYRQRYFTDIDGYEFMGDEFQ